MKNSPTVWFWNFAGFALIPLSIGVCWSLIRATNYKLEAAHHKLEVTTAVDRVRKVSDSLEQTARDLPEPKKQEIIRTLKEAEASLTETQKEILIDEDDNLDNSTSLCSSYKGNGEGYKDLNELETNL